MNGTKLKNAPLKEVIFELHWELTIDSGGHKSDIGFSLAQGKFASKLKSEFPVHRELFPDLIQLKVFGAPMHQYWRGELTWPVVQHGQGMIAVNDTEANYEWDGFKALIYKSVESLVESYDTPLRFNRVKLQYIDAFDLDGLDPVQFVAQNLQTQVNNGYQVPGELNNFAINQIYDLGNSSFLNLNISTAVNNKNQQKSIIWTTTIDKQQSLNPEDLEHWIEEAHNVTSSMFKNILNPDFYGRLAK